MSEQEQKLFEGRRGHRKGAQTFRRGRAVMFYQQLETKRETLRRQLEAPEMESIRPVLIGELKAIEMVIEEFKVAFKLDEQEQE